MPQRKKKHLVVNFHGIGEPHSGIPKDEFPYWVSQQRFIEILDLLVEMKSSTTFQITFDDGNKSDLTFALPRLVERGLSATFFVLTGRLGLSEYLSKQDLNEITSAGMGIGVHGCNHVDWTRVSLTELELEAKSSRQLLANVVNKDITGVAIPFGAYNSKVIRYLKKIGYEHIYTSDGGLNVNNNKIISRFSVKHDTSDIQLICLLNNEEEYVSRSRRFVSTFLRRNII